MSDPVLGRGMPLLWAALFVWSCSEEGRVGQTGEPGPVAGAVNGGGGAQAAGTGGDGGSSAGTPPRGGDGGGGSASGGMAGIDGTAGAGGAAIEVPRSPPFDWVGVVGTGQSLSIGATAGYLSAVQPYGNLTLLDSGPDPKYPLSDGQPDWSLVPLIEPVRAKVAGSGAGYSDGQYPNNVVGETPHSGMANTLSWLWQERGDVGDYVTVHSVVGWSGHCLVDIDKTGGKRAYQGSLSEARAIAELATAQGKTFGYGAIIMTHGECDASTPDYGDGLHTLLTDYNADLKAITGQSEDVVMLVSQQSTKATGSNGSAAQVFRAGNDHPGEIICTGPKYQYQYAPDKLHLKAAGYRRLGEKYAEVFDLVVNRKAAWRPLGPTSATREGDTVRVTFHVPEPPLVWSEEIAPPHQTAHVEWAQGRGFEVVTAAQESVTIGSATIDGDSVVLTLVDPPASGESLIVGYAMTQDGEGNQGGEVTGLRGLLRDSDAFVGADTEEISVVLTQGSKVITSVEPGAFRRRTGFDIVTEGGEPTGLVVATRDTDDQLTLFEPWTGPSGTRSLSFHYDMYNYAVHFSLQVD
ncbi:MAG TPA: dockerin [Polyangiaceae bacterium]|nr:dockerin [Polyangiaceae bacterium]